MIEKGTIGPGAEKKVEFFPLRGDLTKSETALSRVLSPVIDRQRISLASFGSGDLASLDVITQDREKIKNKKNEIQADKAMIAREDKEHLFSIERGLLAEEIIIYCMQQGKWFGDAAKVRVASEYDDLFNGVDSIIEFDNTRQLAIGIDTTISRNKINEKFQGIREKILDGKLLEVKYFKNANFSGSLHNVPLTVIGADLGANASLARLVYDMEMTDQFYSKDKPDRREKAEEAIRGHISQFIILLEIKLELEAFKEFAIRFGQGHLVARLDADLDKIKEILKERMPKNREVRQRLLAEVQKDEVFKLIRQALRVEFTEWEESDIFVAKIKK